VILAMAPFRSQIDLKMGPLQGKRSGQLFESCFEVEPGDTHPQISHSCVYIRRSPIRALRVASRRILIRSIEL